MRLPVTTRKGSRGIPLYKDVAVVSSPLTAEEILHRGSTDRFDGRPAPCPAVDPFKMSGAAVVGFGTVAAGGGMTARVSQKGFP